MRMGFAAMLTATLVFAALAAPAWPGEPPAEPADRGPAAAPPPATRKAPATRGAPRRVYLVQPQQPLTAKQVYDVNKELRVLGKWILILSGLTLLAVIWFGWSMRTLEKNQEELRRKIESLGPPKSQ